MQLIHCIGQQLAQKVCCFAVARQLPGLLELAKLVGGKALRPKPAFRGKRTVMVGGAHLSGKPVDLRCPQPSPLAG